MRVEQFLHLWQPLSLWLRDHRRHQKLDRSRAAREANILHCVFSEWRELWIHERQERGWFVAISAWLRHPEFIDDAVEQLPLPYSWFPEIDHSFYMEYYWEV